MPGIYEVAYGPQVLYVSADGRYLVNGEMFDIQKRSNLTEERRTQARLAALKGLDEKSMIVYPAKGKAKHTVTVFTDIDCGFCRRFHNPIADVNKSGVRVRYMMFPRTGPGTESWRKAEAVWCSKDRRDALTRAKKGEELKTKSCAEAESIKTQWSFGEDLGVEGTPAIFTQTGDYIGGFMTPDQLVQTIQETQKAATAAR